MALIDTLRASADTHRLAHPRYVRFMATITRTYQVDDLDGSEDDVSTVQLALDERAMRSTAVVLAAMVVLGIVNKIVA